MSATSSSAAATRWIRRSERAPARRAAGQIDHISFGIAPWDTDGVKAELEKRGLRAQIDTSSRHLGPDGTYVPDEIHTAAFKSYHTATPNGFNLQISYVTHDNRLALPERRETEAGRRRADLVECKHS